MKKTIMGLILSLISISTFACHFYGGGICGNKVYLHGNFLPNSIFQFRMYGDTTVLLTFTSNSVDTVDFDSTIVLPITPGQTDIRIQFHNHYLGETDYNNWAGNYGSGDYYELIDSLNSACGLLPVTISDLHVQRNNDNLNVSFSAGNETGIKQYNILGSKDGNTWTKLKTITATGATKYNVAISLAGAFAFVLPFMFLYSNKRKWLSLLFMSAIVILYSCKKDIATTNGNGYTFIKIESVSNTNVSTYSPITTIN